MHPPDDQTALPLRRDWTGWLFVLIVVAAVVAVIYASHSTGTRKHAAHRQPVAPPADIVPEVEPMVLAPVTEDDARAQNAEVALITKGFVAARPFVYAGGGDAKARARDCLAAAMLYEAGDDAKGQQAVGQVVINRARHPAFPKSICGVVFQGSERTTGCQFTFTCDGALNRRYSDAAWQRARGNADMMLSGGTYPPVGLATHYHTDWVRPYWSDSLEKIAIVDTHLFFRWPGYWGTPGAFRGAVSGSDGPVAKLAAISPLHAMALGLPVEMAGVDANAAVGEARVVAGAGESAGRDTIYTQLDRKAAPESFVTTALRLCGDKPYCKFMGWTNPVLKPDSDAMSDTQRAAMTFSYLRDDKAGFEKALWNCSEYKRDDVRQCMKR
ncbi:MULTISPECIES: cell wall hydrolase [unclassified Sphingopyxis]|uniref:cell wall hydrolase n=1 Tax=unclassified Sphingopyxis TaxID=2614943 RepID=UPI0028676836|nr:MULTISPECIES: cell wall hydrolase [unclassified Sphingopyxis]MDR7060108.1 spore germination cell wall hydrolase CwlJ-like protein [Sphingopyxis sp. BE235]MDR7180379.1 spore germination cell wall hydrolase CwlJ-like protein [Sphingopyxis sp. BE249]